MKEIQDKIWLERRASYAESDCLIANLYGCFQVFDILLLSFVI